MRKIALVALGVCYSLTLQAQFSRPAANKQSTLGNRSIATTSAGDRVAVGKQNGEVALLSKDGVEKVLTPKYEAPITAVAFSPDGKRLYAGASGQVVAWDAETGALMFSWGTKQSKTARTGEKIWTPIALSSDGKILAKGFKDDVVVYDAQSGKELVKFQLQRDIALSTSYFIRTLCLSSDGRLLAGGVMKVYSIGPGQPPVSEGSLSVWNVHTGELIKSIPGYYKSDINSLAISGDNRLLAVGESKNDLRLIELISGDVLSTVTTKHGSEGVRSVAFVPESNYLLLGGGDGFVSLVDYEQNKTIDFYSNHGDKVESIAVRSDGFSFVSTGLDGKVKTQDVERKESLSKRPNTQIASGGPQSNAQPASNGTGSSKRMGQSDLYMLSIGISKYKQPSLNLSFCDKDAEAVAQRFKKMEGRIFGKVDAKLLLNQDASFVNMRKSLSYLKQNATSSDMILIHISSHGALDNEQNLYIVSHDYEDDDLFATGLKVTDIIESVKSINCKVLVFLDACHSGASGYNLIDFANKKGLVTMNKIANDIFKAQPGLTLIVSSSGNEFSLEKPEWGHGAFTKSLLEGLDGGADFDGDKVIRIAELNLFISRRVKELTNGAQHPFTPINQFGDIPIYVND
jgi:WD40 repeat protein